MWLYADCKQLFPNAHVAAMEEKKAGELKARPPSPWPELKEHDLDELVARKSRCSAQEARQLPMVIWCEVLMKASAEAEVRDDKQKEMEAKSKK